MAYPPDRVPDPHTYEPANPSGPTQPPYTAAPYAGDPSAPPHGAYWRETRAHDDRELRVRDEVTREVTAGPFRFGVREGVLGTLGIFTILGLVLALVAFPAAFALQDAVAELNDADGGNTADDVAAASGLLPALLVSLLPFMAAPVLAIGCGAWAGHASRDGRIGAIAGGIGGFGGPILTLLLVGIGFALGAGAANLDLSEVRVIQGWSIAPGWGNTIPYLFSGAGLLWLVANTIAGALTGGLLGSLLGGRWAANAYRRQRYARSTRY